MKRGNAMSIIGIGDNYNRNKPLNVRQRPKSEINQIEFGEVLKNTPAKDTFTTTPVFESNQKRTVVSDFSDTQAKLDDISEAIKNTDYSGMTNAEIYADIENRYVDAFDDFHITMAIATCKEHIMIHDQFLNDIHSNNAGRAGSALINEARGYSGMSYDEIENTIKEKYVGKTGFIDQLNLFGELFATGVLANKFGAKESIQLALDLRISVECGGNMDMSRKEWLSRVEKSGASSPFDLLINNPSLAKFKDKYQAMVDEILFGIVDKAN